MSFFSKLSTLSYGHKPGDIDVETLPSFENLFKASSKSQRSAATSGNRGNKAKGGASSHFRSSSASTTSVNSADSRKAFDSSPWLKSLANMQLGVDNETPSSSTASRPIYEHPSKQLNEDEIERQCLVGDKDQNGLDMQMRLESLGELRRNQSQRLNSTVVKPPRNNPPFPTRGQGRPSSSNRGGRGGNKPLPTPSELPSQASAREQALENQLGRVFADLDDLQQLNAKLTKENQSLSTQIRFLKGRLNESRILLESKDQEKQVVREELDQALQKLRKSERRNRYVGDSDRWKADANYRKRRREISECIQDGDEGDGDEVLKERRGAQGLLAKSVTEVTGMMGLFNEELFQTSAVLSELIKTQDKDNFSPSSLMYERAERVLGDQMLSMIHQTNPGSVNPGPLLVQIVIQVFLTHWCNSIIEGWYPKQTTFAEFLVEICSNIRVGENRALCGMKSKITQSHTRDSDNLFYEWILELSEDLLDVISVFGWTIPSYNALERCMPSEMKQRLMNLVKSAYDIRTAMAEISTSGDVDLVLISNDTPFNATLMENSYEEGVNPSGGNFVEHVVGTTGIGLQREIPRLHSNGLWRPEVDVVLRPKVVLENSLLASLDA